MAKLLPTAIPSCMHPCIYFLTFFKFKVKLKYLKILTARAIIPVTMPVLIAPLRYFESKFKSVIEAGFIPFFSSPICNHNFTQSLLFSIGNCITPSVHNLLIFLARFESLKLLGFKLVFWNMIFFGRILLHLIIVSYKTNHIPKIHFQILQTSNELESQQCQQGEYCYYFWIIN